MALTAAQTRSVFEILEVPYLTTYNTVTGVGALTASTSVAGAGTSAAYTALNTSITALAADDETKVTALVTEWDSIRLDTTVIQSGGISNISGVSYNPAEKRALIKQLMQVYLPYFRAHEVFAKDMGPSMTIPVIR